MQIEAWTREIQQANLASTKRKEISRALTWFLDTVNPPLDGKRVIEFGCGNGRNLAYLARQGAICTGVDFVPEILRRARIKISKLHLNDSVTILKADLGESLPFPDVSFDIGLDFLAGCSLFDQAWETYRKEVVRVLAPGGYFVTYYFDADSPGHWRARSESPGPFPNSIINPNSGIIERAFSRTEVLREFSDLKLVASDIKVFNDKNHLKQEQNALLLTVLQKPNSHD